MAVRRPTAGGRGCAVPTTTGGNFCRHPTPPEEGTLAALGKAARAFRRMGEGLGGRGDTTRLWNQRLERSPVPQWPDGAASWFRSSSVAGSHRRTINFAKPWFSAGCVGLLFMAWAMRRAHGRFLV